MKIGIFAPYHSDWRITTTMDSVIAGFKNLNENYFVQNLRFYKKCDVAILFGIYSNKHYEETEYRKEIIDTHIKEKKPYVIVERGYIDRNHYYSMGINGLNGRGIFNNKDSKSYKFDNLNVEIQNWRKDVSKAILIAGQIPWDTSVQHVNYNEWLYDLIISIKTKYPKKDVIFRPHPLQSLNVYSKKIINTLKFYEIEISNKTLTNDFDRSSFLLTFNSTTQVESLLYGLPTITFDDGSILRNITNTKLDDIEKYKYKDRQQSFFNLAYAQWTWKEFSDGIPWKRLKSKIKTL